MIGVGQDDLHLTGQQLLWSDAFHRCLCAHRHEHGGREYPMWGSDAAEAGLCSRVTCENFKAEWHRRILRSTGSVASSTVLPLVQVLCVSTFLLQGNVDTHSTWTSGSTVED